MRGEAVVLVVGEGITVSVTIGHRTGDSFGEGILAGFGLSEVPATIAVREECPVLAERLPVAPGAMQ